MKALAALAAAFALAAPSPPDWLTPTGPGTRYYDGPPPARFVGETGALVLFVAPARVAELCAMPVPPGKVLVACMRRLEGGMAVIVAPHPAGFPNERFSLILNHELAHVNSWPGDHPL